MDPNNSTAIYINNIGTNASAIQQLSVSGVANWGNGYVSMEVKKEKAGIHPELYFKYIKSKFGVIEKMKLDARLKRLEAAFNKAVDNGQEALAEKFLKEITREARESVLYVKGIKHFIEKSDLDKHKRNIRGGHISDTKFGEFTRVIPKDVLKKKKEVENLFDGFVIYHVWNDEAEKKREKKQKISSEEKSKMRDPVLFGVIRESNRLYFIADWTDEFCDLSFEELIDHLGSKEEDITINRNPKLI